MTDAAPVEAEIPFAFAGSTRDYFCIWSVNLLFTLATLGLYSPWAKVRARQYLHSSTRIGSLPFQYLAQPLPILYGRLLAAALFAAYVLAGNLAPLLQPVTVVAVALATPWLLVRGLRFRAHYSSLAAVRFRFVGGTRGAYRYYVFAWLLVPLSLGFAYPAVQAWQRRWLIDHHELGGAALVMQAPTESFYPIYFAAGLFIAVFTTASGLLGTLIEGAWALAATGGGYAAFGIASAYVHARVWNLSYGSVEVRGHRLRASARARDVAALWATNLVALAATLGLAYPWTVVRMARYRAAHLWLLPSGELGEFVAEPGGDEGSAGAEIAELFGVEVGL